MTSRVIVILKNVVGLNTTQGGSFFLGEMGVVVLFALLCLWRTCDCHVTYFMSCLASCFPASLPRVLSLRMDPDFRPLLRILATEQASSHDLIDEFNLMSSS